MKKHQLHTTLDTETFNILKSQQVRFGKINETIKVALKRMDEEGWGPATLDSGGLRSLSRDRLGINPLDECLQDGIPRGSLVLVRGPPGSGKTSLSLQFLMEGTRVGQKGVYFSFQESIRHLVMHIREMGWNMSEWKESRLAMVELFSMVPRLWSLVLGILVKSEPRRIVLDPVDYLLRDDGLEEFAAQLRKHEITAIMVHQGWLDIETDISYLADVVLELQSIRPRFRHVQVTKSRLVPLKESGCEFGFNDYISH